MDRGDVSAVPVPSSQAWAPAANSADAARTTEAVAVAVWTRQLETVTK